MKFLADMGVSQTTVRALRDVGHDVVHLVELGLERLNDSSILGKAREEGRTVLTFDLDFGELLAIAGSRLPSVILFRLRDATPASVNVRLMQVVTECAAALDAGAIVTVEEGRYRVRRLPIRST